MQILKTSRGFEYFHIIEKRMIKTTNAIPFIINWDGKLENEINQYLIFKTETDWNPTSKTPINNAEQILIFLDFCISSSIKDWKSISSTDLKKYIATMTKSGKREGTIKTRISGLQSLFDWLYSFNLISSNPFATFNKKETKHIINVFSSKTKTIIIKSSSLINSIVKDEYKESIPTKEEIKNFYKELSVKDRLMALFLIETGVRKSELLQLRIDDILEGKESNTGNSYSVLLNARKMKIKYNKSRNIIISSLLREKLLNHYYSEINSKYVNNFIKNNDESPFLFLSNRSNRLSSDVLNKSFKKASVLSGYFKQHSFSISPHNLRHFYASHFIYNKEKSGDVNLEDAYMYLSERLGHSSVETTKSFYVKIVSKVKQQLDIEKYSESFISGFLEGAE